MGGRWEIKRYLTKQTVPFRRVLTGIKHLYGIKVCLRYQVHMAVVCRVVRERFPKTVTFEWKLEWQGDSCLKNRVEGRNRIKVLKGKYHW